MIYTVIATLLLSALCGFEVYSMGIFAFVFEAIFFSIMGEGRHLLVSKIRMRSEVAKARRENGQLKIDEGADILKNPYDNTPVFYEKNRKGQEVPVRIQFYGFRRIFSMILKIMMFEFFPLIVAAIIRFVDISGTSELFFNHFRPEYGAAWYVLAGLVVIIYYAKGIRRDVYEHPILYEVGENRKKKLLGTRSSRRLNMFAAWGSWD